MSREINVSQIQLERNDIEQQSISERGTDEITAEPNLGVIVISPHTPVNFPMGLSGSLTKLSNGQNYLEAGQGITLTTGSNGSITITSMASGIPIVGNNKEIQYNAGNGSLGSDPNLTFDPITKTLTVTNLSGSLTKLANGQNYLIAGTGIDISTGSLGNITISSKVSLNPVWQNYNPTISGLTLPTSHEIYGKFLIQNNLMTVMFSLSGTSTQGSVIGSGIYTINLPQGYMLDTSMCVYGSSNVNYINGSNLGNASLLMNTPGTGGSWSVVPIFSPSDSIQVVLLGKNTNGGNILPWGYNHFPLDENVNTYRISFLIEVPIIAN